MTYKKYEAIIYLNFLNQNILKSIFKLDLIKSTLKNIKKGGKNNLKVNRKFISNSNYVFRKVINNEECLDIIKDFIESILNINIKEIELNPYLKGKARYLPKEENFGVADVRITTESNEEINIGIQFIDGIYIQTKMLMYYAQIHLNQLEYDKKREFAKTITINLLDFKYFSSSEYIKKIKIQSNEGNIKLEELELYVIELPKFICKNSENISKREEWITYLKGCNNKILEKIKNSNKNIKLLDELTEKYWLTEKME